MVKRPKTPPPPEDEPRYLVVVHPYPLNADLRLRADQRTLALWVACCTGKDALLAMFYKPTSPGMVIIEVDRGFERFDTLLGKHTWTSFLKYPTAEDEDKASKVFWCFYNTGRLVQKNGWKRVDVEEHWFHGWSPHNDIIKHPYPKTTYCDLPAEAQTGAPLCRPLPGNTFTPPPPKPRPTVGSPEWVQSQSSNVNSGPPSSSRRRRGNHGSIAPSDSVSVISAGSAIEARPPPPGPHLVQWVDDQRVKGPIWATPPSSLSSGFTLSFSAASSSVGSRAPSAVGAPSAAAPAPSRSSVPARPPGLSPLSGPHRSYERLKWSDEVEISIGAQDDAPTSPQSSGTSTTRAPGGRTAPPRRAPNPEGAIDPDQDYEYEEEDAPKRSTGDAMRAIFDGAPGVAVNNAGLRDLEEEEEEEDYVAWNYPQAVGTTARDWAAGGDGDDEDEDEDNEAKDPWEGYDAPRWERPTRIPIKGGEEWICPDHGATCNPGICKARALVEFERRKEKERDEWAEAKRRRLEKWKKREAKKAKAEGRELSLDQPHLAAHRYRGAGGSGSDSEDSRSQSSDSSTGPGTRPPQNNAAGAEGWPEEGSLWDDGDKAAPKVSLPSSGRSASGSNRIEGEDSARSVGGPSGTANPTNNPTNSPRATHSAAASTSAWSVPSARGNITGHNSARADASERPQSMRPGDARGTAGARPAATSPRGDGPPTPRSPVPGPRQSAWGARGTATSSTRGGAPTSSQWPTPGQPHLPSNSRSPARAWTSTHSDRSTGPDMDAAPTPWSRQGNGRQRDRGRDSTSASSSTGSHSQNFRPIDGGFPTFADTTWGDPIAAAQSSRKSKKSASGTSSATSRSVVSDDIADGKGSGDNERSNAEAGEQTTGQNDRTGRGRRGRRGARRGIPGRTTASPPTPSSTSQDAPRPNVLEVTLPPAGPGAQWCDENVEW